MVDDALNRQPVHEHPYGFLHASLLLRDNSNFSGIYEYEHTAYRGRAAGATFHPMAVAR